MRLARSKEQHSARGVFPRLSLGFELDFSFELLKCNFKGGLVLGNFLADRHHEPKDLQRIRFCERPCLCVR